MVPQYGMITEEDLLDRDGEIEVNQIVQDDDRVDAILNIVVETKADTSTDDVEKGPTNNFGSAQVQPQAIARVECIP